MPSATDIAGSVVPGLGDIWKGITQGQLSDWLKAALINVLNNQRAGQEFGQNLYLSNQDPLRDMLLQNRDLAQSMYWGAGGAPGMMPQAWDMSQQWAGGGLMDLARNLGQWTTPQFEAGQQGLFDTAGQYGAIAPTAAQLFLGGGWSQPGQNIMDRAMEIGTGQGWQMAQPATTGGSLLGNFGINPYTAATQQYGLQGLQSGGRTPYTDALAQFGMMGLMGGGLTPSGQTGEASALETLLQGGQTPISNYMQQLGATQASDEPLLPMTQALSMARDQAGTAAAQQAQAYMQRALARGGGPGAVIASGLQNQGMREFSDTALAQEAQAMRDMALQQQGLQLQRQAQGGSLAQQQAALENQRLQTMMGGLGNLEDVAARRYLGAGGWLGEAQGQATNLMNVLGNLGLGGVGAETSRMGLGGNLLNQYNQTRLGGLGAAQQALSSMNQMALGGGQLYNQLLGGQAGAYNQYINNLLGSGTLGAQRFRDISGAQNQAFGNLGTLTGQMGGQISSIYAPWTSMANQQLGFTGGLYGNEPGLFNPMFSQAYTDLQGNRGKGVIGGAGDLVGTIFGF